jgi:hypothetical protein
VELTIKIRFATLWGSVLNKKAAGNWHDRAGEVRDRMVGHQQNPLSLDNVYKISYELVNVREGRMNKNDGSKYFPDIGLWVEGEYQPA